MCHFDFLLELPVGTSWVVWLTLVFWYNYSKALTHPEQHKSCFFMACSNALPIFAACSCSRYRMLLVQYDHGERYKLGVFHRWLEMCWVCSLAQTWWPGGSPLWWCTSAWLCHCVGDRACSCTGTFPAPSPRLFGLEPWPPHSPSPTPFGVQPAVWGVLIWTAHVQLSTTWESHVGCWVCCTELAQRRTKCHLDVVSSLSAMVLFFRFTPCCIFLM